MIAMRLALDDAVLSSRASGGFGIGDAGERDHGVERQINPGKQPLEQVIELLFRPKFSRRRLVAHLDKVFDGEVGERVGVLFSPRKISPLRSQHFVLSGACIVSRLRCAHSCVPGLNSTTGWLHPAAAAIIFASSLTMSSDAATGWIREPFPVKDFRT